MEYFRKSKDQMINYMFGVCIFLFPILDQYSGISSHISMGEVILIALLVILTATKKVNFKLDKKAQYYASFLAVALLCSVISGATNTSFSFNSMILLWGRMLVYALFIKYAYDYSMNGKKYANIYIAICLCLCVYLFTQYIAYYLFGKILSNFVPILPIKSSLVDYASRNMAYVYSISFRPSSLFSEPAKLAQYLLPCLIILFFSEIRSKYRGLMIAIISAGIVLSTSFMGILICAFLYALYFLKGKFTIQKIGFVFFAVAFFAFIYFRTDLITRNITRVSSGLINSTGTSSASLRLLRGWEIYYHIPPLYKIIGVGLNGLQDFINSHSIVIKYGGNYAYGEYASTITYVLNCCGLIGLISFVRFLKGCSRYADRVSKILISVVIIMSFGSSFLVTPIWVLYFTIIFCSKKITSEEHYEY